MVTLRQVAERAGVSIKTVSRIVNDDPAVKPETRDAVLSHLKDMNYVPDQAARLMRSGASNVVGLMTDAVATTPYSVDIVRGAQAELKRDHKTLLIASSDGDPELEDEYWRMFRAHKVSRRHLRRHVPPLAVHGQAGFQRGGDPRQLFLQRRRPRLRHSRR